VGCGEGVSPSPLWEGSVGRGLGRWLCPLPRKIFRFWISNRRILVQTGCFLRSSPKTGLNAVLVRRKPNCQTLSVCMPMNDLSLLLFGLRNCCCLCSRGSQVWQNVCYFVNLLCAILIDIVVCRLLQTVILTVTVHCVVHVNCYVCVTMCLICPDFTELDSLDWLYRAQRIPN